MIQEATDADIIARAEGTLARHRARISDDSVAADLLGEVEILLDALRRHQPVPPKESWNDAWQRFDEKPA